MIHTLKSLSDVYPDPEPQIPRYTSLKTTFESKYACSPDFIIRAPGRVNIIGDHIDYSYLPVLPMSIQADMIMAVKIIDERKVCVANTDESFPPNQFDISEKGEVVIDSTKTEWSNYMKCGVAVGLRYLLKSKPDLKVKGMLVAITGNIPSGGGLSSSAAFVVGSTLSTLKAHGENEVGQKLLTTLSITCEQLIGVNSGGMDQAASVYGQRGHALFVSFRPDLAVTPMSFPESKPPVAFLIANSLVTAVKHETAPIHYNLRVVEVTLASIILAKKLSVSIPQDGNLFSGTLRGVLEAYHQTSSITPDVLESMLPLVNKHLKRDGYTKREVAEELGISEQELTEKYLTTFPVRFETLKLHARATHVYSESARVFRFIETMQSGAPDANEKLGALMNASHESARDLFENSHPKVDELVEVALSAGSIGSRVTGAGWGGCTIHLVPLSKIDSVKKALREKYYSKYFTDVPDDAVIESTPAIGALILPNIFPDL